MNKPLKRVKELQPLSREHHDALLLCWKIRTGMAKGVSPQRIHHYAQWFYRMHLKPHFQIEEEVVFPVLGHAHKHIQEALQQHARLHAMFAQADTTEQALMDLQASLEQHIRFEERVLFMEIQHVASRNQLLQIGEAHPAVAFEENTDDLFWV